MSVSRHIALFSTTHCLDKIELTFLIEIAAFSKCRICLHPHVSQMEHFSNGVILKSNISQMEHFSNEAILKSNISQMKHFSNRAFLKWSNSQIKHFSNGAILNWSILGSPPYAIFQDPKNREIWHAMCYMFNIGWTYIISWHFMAFWHVCQKANCITKSAFSAFFRLSAFFTELDF